jgi:hypothetical protein
MQVAARSKFGEAAFDQDQLQTAANAGKEKP